MFNAFCSRMNGDDSLKLTRYDLNEGRRKKIARDTNGKKSVCVCVCGERVLPLERKTGPNKRWNAGTEVAALRQCRK